MPLRLLRRGFALALPAFLAAQSPGFPDIKPGRAQACAATSFTYGHCQFSLGPGTLVPLEAAGKTVGFYYQGNGQFTYRSVDPVEHAVLTYNVENNTDLKPLKDENGMSLQSAFTWARFWISDGTLPLHGQGLAANQDTITDYTVQSDRWSGIQATRPEDMLAYAQANPAVQPWIRAELRGEKSDFLYELDPVLGRTEGLAALRSPRRVADKEMSKWLLGTPLSLQPFGWNLRQPQPAPYMLTAVDVSLDTADNRNAKLNVKERILPLQPLQALQFNLSHRIGVPVGETGVEWRWENVKQVLTAEGKPLPFHHDMDTLTVLLPERAEARKAMDLTFDIEGDFLITPGGDNYFELGTSPWFPQPELNGQSYTFHTTVKVKKPWQAFAPGNTVRRTTEGDYTLVETLADKPIAFGVILAGDYAIKEETREGRTVRVATYALKSGFTKELADMAFATLKYYEGFMGPYPFKEFQILEKNEWGYGQAPASIMFITKEAFNQTVDIMNKIVSIDVRHRFVHEIAHQWWGTLVKMPSLEEQWLTESFADISAGLALEDWKGKGEYNKQVGPWRSEGRWASKFATIPTANRIANPKEPYERFRARTGLIYNKGAYLLHAIRMEIGDELFFKFLKSYQASFKWRFGTTKDVAGLLKVITGKDWQPWFEKYYWGTEFPSLKD
jgi:hypothetical protein